MLTQVLSPWIEGNTLAGDTGVQDTSLPDIVISLVSPGVVYTEFGVNALHGGVDTIGGPNV